MKMKTQEQVGRRFKAAKIDIGFVRVRIEEPRM